jgi:predicted RNase H-like HicB family nuclease
MEQIVNLYIEKLPEGVYLATSDDVSGLVAQGRTVAEAIEIAFSAVLAEVRAAQ